MKLIIAGSRDFQDYEFLKHSLAFFLDITEVDPKDLTIVSGGARGADALGERFAKEFNIPVEVFPANWNLHGKAAGMIRNRQMAEYADHLIAFRKNESKGTTHMINCIKKLNKPSMTFEV